MARKAAGRKASKVVPPRQRRARQARRAEGRDDRSDYRNKVQAQKVEAANKKGGCLPKLGMFLLPFVAAGTYLVLHS